MNNPYDKFIYIINNLDTLHLVTYYWGCFFLVILMLFIYFIFSLIFLLIVSKKRALYLQKLDDETKKHVLEYKHINIFTKIK